MEPIDRTLHGFRPSGRESLQLVTPAASEEPPHGWPPPPHDPRERIEIALVEGWEVRAFREHGVKHRYFAPRGMLHLQLWHPPSGVSLLTPSRLTAERYEAYPIAGWKFAHAELRAVRGAIRGLHGVELPSSAAIRALERWYVARFSRASARPLDVTTGDND